MSSIHLSTPPARGLKRRRSLLQPLHEVRHRGTELLMTLERRRHRLEREVHGGLLIDVPSAVGCGWSADPSRSLYA